MSSRSEAESKNWNSGEVRNRSLMIVQAAGPAERQPEAGMSSIVDIYSKRILRREALRLCIRDVRRCKEFLCGLPYPRNERCNTSILR